MFVLEWIFLVYFLYVVSYALFFGIGGFFYKKIEVSDNIPDKRKYLILVPGYKEDSVIINTADQNSKINYPKDKYEVVVIADSFEKETLDNLSKLPIKVIKVSFEKSTKVRAMKKALEKIEKSYDYLIVLDADNLMEEDYLKKVDSYIEIHNSLAIQTQRAPKNKNNELAVLDGISESINNHIYRMGSSALGFSASLNGSGMVFGFHIFKDIISQMDSIGGFDRELEYRLLEQGIKVKYLKEAIVYDEKVDDGKTFESQRKRWISSQYVYLFKYLNKGLKALLKGNFVYFNSTVWRNIQLPRLINLGLLTLITLLAVLAKNILIVHYSVWIGLWLVNAIVMAICIPRSFYNIDLLKSILMLPKIFIKMFMLMFKLKGANKKFIHTPHKTSH